MSGRPMILVVEDDPVLGPALAQRLRLEGFEPQLATTGAAALAAVARRRPAAIISDIRLPDMSGFDVFAAPIHGRRMLVQEGQKVGLFQAQAQVQDLALQFGQQGLGEQQGDGCIQLEQSPCVVRRPLPEVARDQEPGVVDQAMHTPAVHGLLHR